MRFTLFGGGEAGRLAAVRLSTALPPGTFASIVWDKSLGEPPTLTDVPVTSLDAVKEDPNAVLLCSGYGHILDATTINAFGGGAFNAHPSLLPAYRGRHAIQWAIAEGETIFGVTVHRLCAAIDRGEHVMMRAVRLGLDVDAPEISSCLAAMAAELLVELSLKLLAREPLIALPQDPRADRYLRRRTPQDGCVRWADAGTVTIGKVRAASPAYPAYAQRADGSVVVFRGKVVGRTPGEVLISTEDGALIATGDGVVWLKPDRPLEVGEILR